MRRTPIAERVTSRRPRHEAEGDGPERAEAAVSLLSVANEESSTMTANGKTTATATRALPDEKPQTVLALEIEIRRLLLPIHGTSPLIVHRWSEKAKKEMLDKQMKRATRGKEAKDPERDYEESLYRLDDGGFGFPAIAFKAAAVRAGTYCDMAMTYTRGTFHVDGELVKLKGEPRPREDMVRIGKGTADIRYRAEFSEWSVELPISYNERAITPEQIVNLFNLAGFAVGVGEWRPEKDGQFGRFAVAR